MKFFTRNIVRAALLITSVMVVSSYALGYVRMANAEKILWGGIPEILKNYFSFCGLLATLGFIVICWYFLYQWDPEAVEKIKWPWQTNAQEQNNGEAENNWSR